jgi:DNA-binding transcriptional LysR family regulator
MEMTQIRAFVAASRERNIGRAAERLRLTPSPVSRTLRQFEREVGGDVFVRDYHDLRLTPLGERALPVAVELLALAGELGRVAEPLNGPLRVGSTPWIPGRYLQQIVELAEESRGSVTSSEMSSVLLHQLRHGELDLAVVHLPLDIEGIASQPLARYHFHLFTRPGNPLSELPEIRLSDLAASTVLMMPSEMQPVAMHGITDRLAEAGIRDIVTLDLRDWISVPSRIRQTDAVTLGSLSKDSPFATLLASSELTSTPLADGEVEMQVGVAWRARDALRGPEIQELRTRLYPREGEKLDVLE